MRRSDTEKSELLHLLLCAALALRDTWDRSHLHANFKLESEWVIKQRWMQGAPQKLSVALIRGESWLMQAGISVRIRVAPRTFQALEVLSEYR